MDITYVCVQYSLRRVLPRPASAFVGEHREVLRRMQMLLHDEKPGTIDSNEAARRIRFFVNSLYMDMPLARPAYRVPPFSTLTPYFKEEVRAAITGLAG
jgi:callose synthase